MADIKVSAMSSEASPSLDDLLMLIEMTSGTNKKVDLSALITLLSANIPAGTIGADEIDWSTSGEVWWEELGRTTLSSAGDTISVSGFAAKKYLKFVAILLPSGNIQGRMIFNNDTGSNYAHRYQIDNTVGSNVVSGGNIGDFCPSGSNVVYVTGELMNNSANRKMGYVASCHDVNAGAATAPAYVQFFFKWANTSAQVTRIDITNAASGDFAAGSLLIVMGHD